MSTPYQLLPDLTADEYAALRADIAARGVQVPVELDEEGHILDGHHRVRACQELGIAEWPRIVRVGLSEEQKTEHVLALNLDRRHLNREQQRQVTESVLRMHPDWANRRVARAVKSDDHTVASVRSALVSTAEIPQFEKRVGSDGKSRPASYAPRTRADEPQDAVGPQGARGPLRVASYAPGSERDEAPEDEGDWSPDPDMAPRAETTARPAVGLLNPRRGDIERARELYDTSAMPPGTGLMDRSQLRQAHKGLVARERQEEHAQLAEQARGIPQSDRWQVEQGDIRTYQTTQRFDFIITDPPYPREYLDLYPVLAHRATEWLKPGGSLLVMVGQSYLPEVLSSMAAIIPYRWTLAYLTPGGQAVQLWQRKVNTFWKPVLWFTQGDYAGPWVGDVARSAPNDNDKEHHAWGQSESGMADLIERFTLPGQAIMDPFCGGGTTGVVAVALGRVFMGIDVDAESITTTKGRLAEYDRP